MSGGKEKTMVSMPDRVAAETSWRRADGVRLYSKPPPHLLGPNQPEPAPDRSAPDEGDRKPLERSLVDIVTIDRLIVHFERLLTAALAAPALVASELPMLFAIEHHQEPRRGPGGGNAGWSGLRPGKRVGSAAPARARPEDRPGIAGLAR